ncbi:MAG: flagellar motor switch protein FliG [Deltaproteobacteria bacterium]|nr:flagellar motor switch protein FliG [Deltaproteobacteria bacterium]MBW1960799.1 flagellar motor switch protein FliG [Deltaproteobacteria bacterium]MBW2151756.1 flagellar motor switch protein FliG [Deltaproteobacteria bacterium]
MTDKKLDPNHLSGPQKAAIFLLALGEEFSSEIFRRLSEDEIKKVAASMAEIEQIPKEAVNTVLKEFVDSFGDQGRLAFKGEVFLKTVIGKSLDKNNAKSIFKEIEDRKLGLPFVWSRDVDVATLLSHIQGEHPQTIAMIMAYLPAEIASEIMVSLPEDKKGDIALRIAQLGKVPEEIVRDVDKALRAKMSDYGVSGKEAGGLQTLVDILNNVDRATEDIIMETIEEEQAEIANEIRGMMFVFEDLLKVDDRGMREILKKVESQQLVLAMKTASEEMKQKILDNLSSRAAEMLLEDLEVMGPVRLTEVEEAQQGIVRVAKELEAEGTIVLGKGKEDVLV